jgi:hypothetical protein
MKRHAIGIVFRVLFIAALFAFVACSEAKKVTQDSITAKEAFAVAEEIREAYLNRDRAAIETNCTTNGYRDMVGAIKNFEKAELDFAYKWVDIEQSSVSLRVAWSGKWTISNKTVEERGIAIFLLEGNPLKLNKILRENPFKQPE